MVISSVTRNTGKAFFNVFFILFVSIFFICVLFSCTPKQKKILVNPVQRALVRLESENYPIFSDDLSFDGLRQAILRSQKYFNKMPTNKVFRFGSDEYSTEDLTTSLDMFLEMIDQKPSPDVLNHFIRENFIVYKSPGRPETGDILFTGYYEPSLNGSLEKKGPYQYPVFGAPADLIRINLRLFSDKKAFRRTLIGRFSKKDTIVPYYTRQEIGSGEVLMDKAPILAYVDNPIDLFFLEIQGSGIIYLDSGAPLRVHYHKKNGHPYKSIGTYLIRNAAIPQDEMSMQRIREYLIEHPEEQTDIFNYNPSYVFFKKEEGGPYGCYNVEVTPGRTIATDRRIFPACALAFISTKKPLINAESTIVEWVNFGRFVMNQDTGGAIRGPGRADIFKGNGKYAEIAAGHTQHSGDLYFLVLKKKK